MNLQTELKSIIVTVFAQPSLIQKSYMRLQADLEIILKSEPYNIKKKYLIHDKELPII